MTASVGGLGASPDDGPTQPLDVEQGAHEPERRLEGRGRTTVADHVVERIAARAAADVHGVVRRRPGSGLLPGGRDLPSAEAEVAGGRARVHLHVAAAWEVPARGVAAEVRGHVRERLAALTGLTVDRVDVTIDELVPRSRRDEEARRVV